MKTFHFDSFQVVAMMQVGNLPLPLPILTPAFNADFPTVHIGIKVSVIQKAPRNTSFAFSRRRLSISETESFVYCVTRFGISDKTEPTPSADLIPDYLISIKSSFLNNEWGRLETFDGLNGQR
jgi:hypothetical protein